MKIENLECGATSLGQLFCARGPIGTRLQARIWAAVLSAFMQPMCLQGDEESALTAIKSLGGNVNIDGRRSDRPISGVHLSGPKITNEGLQTLLELKHLSSIQITRAKITDEGVKTLTAIKGLRSLSLFGCPVTDSGLLQLANLPSLESLDVRGTSITNAGLSSLNRVSALRILKISAYGGVDLAALKNLASLEHLCIEGWPPRGNDSSSLGDLKMLPKLTSLTLTYVPEAYFQGLSELTNLKWLDLSALGWLTSDSGHLLTDRGIAELKTMTQLRSLNLSGRQVNDAGFAVLSELTHLDLLDLSNSNIADAGIKHFLAFKELQSLDLTGTLVTDQAVQELRSALTKTTITFRGKTPTSQITAARNALLKLGGLIQDSVESKSGKRTVVSVRLAANKNVSDESIKILKEFPELSNVDVSRTALTDVGVSQLKELKKMWKLSFEGVQLTDAGLVHLKDMSGLSELFLSQTQVSDVGLAELRPLKKLHVLKLNHTKVTDAGMQELSQLPCLTTLELRGLPVTDRGLRKLVVLKDLKMLTIDRGNEVSEACLEELKSALPGLTIKVLESESDSPLDPKPKR
jgi:Leucine-rich repeat (LRR) protein